jgi:hypothetical protein
LEEAINPKKERETLSKWLDLKSLPLNNGNSAFVYLKLLKEGLHGNSVNSLLQILVLPESKFFKLIHV